MIKRSAVFRSACLVIGITGFSLVHGEPAPWKVDYGQSKVSFFAKQAGAEFQGHWDEWTAEVRFDPEDLEQSHAIAHFHVSSVRTFDPERDATLQDAEWFHGVSYPVATFEASGFETNADGSFNATSELEVKGLRTPLTFRFNLRQEAGMTVLEGTAAIDRLAAGIGTGEWMDTAWIGQFVRVEVILYATTAIDFSS